MCVQCFQGHEDICCLRDEGHTGKHGCYIDDSHNQRKFFEWDNECPGLEDTNTRKDPTVDILEKLFSELSTIEDRLEKIEHAIQANHK
jgi:hypothetical protein